MEEFVEVNDSAEESAPSEQKKSWEEPRRHHHRRHNITAEDFLIETDEDERSLLKVALDAVIVDAIERAQAVYLEGFGILFPQTISPQVTEVLDRKIIIRNEKRRTVSFEKCYDLISLYRERFNAIVESRELVKAVRAKLPASITWSERDVRRYVRGLIQLIKYESVVLGHSLQLPSIGQFFSLHNRQGAKETDWFAGADIFLKPSYEHTLLMGTPRICERPTLASAWLPLESEAGRPWLTTRLDLKVAIAELNHPTEEIELPTNDPQVALFKKELDGAVHLMWCTNGVRDIGIKARGRGNELTFQITLPREHGLEDKTLLKLGLRALTMGCLVVASAPDREIGIGSGFALSGSIFKELPSDLTAIFCTRHQSIQAEQLSVDGPFTFINILGITSDEAQVAERYSPSHLFALLAHRTLDEITRPQRSSIVARTGLLSKASGATH